MENIDSYKELKKLDELIESATELAALKPIYFRLNEIIQGFPGDFDVQFTGNEVKQRLMARGALLKQQGGPPSPPPAAAPPPPPTPVLESVSPPAAPPAPQESPVINTEGPSPSFPLFPLFAGAPAAPEAPAPPADFAESVGPAPAAPAEPTVTPAATLLALSYTSPAPASPERPPLDLGVTQPPPPPISNLDIAAPAPPVSREPPVAPAAPPVLLASPLFDFASPEQATSAFAVPPENPHRPPAATPAAQPHPLPTSFLDTVAPAASPFPLESPFFDSAPPAPPPAASAMAPEKPPKPPARPAKPPAPPRPPFKWNRPVVIAPIAVLLIAAIAASLVLYRAHKRNLGNAARNAATVQVDIATTPPGASVKATLEKSAAGNEAACTSNCKLALAPGSYQISASLDGFEPAAGAVTVRALKPMAISLMLQPRAQSVRLLTDLDQAKVVVDNQPPVDLQEGQLVLDKVAPGTHTMKVTGQNGDASFTFEISDARIPAVSGPVNARNMVAVLVASFGKQARLVTNAGPWKLAVNGQPQGDASPGGTDLTTFQPGVNEIVLGEGQDQRNMSESFGAAPTLTAFLKTDVNAGTLIVSTGQDDVHVFLNGKEYRRLTQHGQLRVPTLGKVAVRVAKSGFQDEPAQTADVKKGAEVRLQFNLKPLPQFGSLQIHDAMAGVEVLIDQKVAGTVGPDGLFSLGQIPPGDHTIELRREQHLPKTLRRSFQAGQAVVLAGADVVLSTANGTIRIAARNPASATITYRRGDETDSHELRGSQIELPAGTYVFTATAPGFNASTKRVQLATGESREVDFTLAREQAASAPVVANAMALFEDPGSWTKDGDSWVRKGGGFAAFKPSPKGVLTFNVELVKSGGVFHAGQIRWCLQYIDSKNYLLYEIDRKNFRSWVIKNGQRLERVPKTGHNLGNQKLFTIQIEVTPDHAAQKLRVGDEWQALDIFSEPGRDFTQGKFGFLLQGNDEIAISDFKFQPK
ncbi:MAG: PEGA domain-containing protein [Bryobacteraceae bacterium]